MENKESEWIWLRMTNGEIVRDFSISKSASVDYFYINSPTVKKDYKIIDGELYKKARNPKFTITWTEE